MVIPVECKSLLFLFGLISFIVNCNNQPSNSPRLLPPLIGGGCDGCELMFIGMPETISAVDTGAGWYEKGQKLRITGTVYRTDGHTPAPDVIIYYWQTDNDGYYSPGPGMDEKAKRHGHIRVWMKTDAQGRYALYTLRPAPYPGDVLPAHIHLSVKEPDVADEYYVDELNFSDDLLLAPYLQKHPAEKRGGSGIMDVVRRGDVQEAEHDIILGLNIPGYPARSK